MDKNYFKELPPALPAGRKSPLALPAWPTHLALAPYRAKAYGVVGLLRNEIANEIEKILATQPTDGLFTSAQQNMALSATTHAAEQVYDRHFSGKLREVTKDDFVSYAQQMLLTTFLEKTEEEQMPQDAVFTRNGIAFVDHSVVETVMMREKMKGKQEAISQQKKAIDRAYRTKVTKLFHERENELMRQRYPEVTEQELSARHKIIKSVHFSTVQKKRDAYIQQHPLTDEKEWLRTFATRMYRDHIKFAERSDFLALSRHALQEWKIDTREVEHARKCIHHRGQQVMHLASAPRASVFSPQELDEWEAEFNTKYYHLAQEGRTYCAELYQRVRTIQQYGMPMQELYHTLSQLPIYATTTVEQKPPLPDLFPHYPKRQKQTRVPFVEAVTRVIEAHPHRYEQDILWQLFFRYNYRHRNIKPLPETLQPQAEQAYRKRKHREREQKTADTLRPSLWPDLFQGEITYKEELIDFLAGRISWVGR